MSTFNEDFVYGAAQDHHEKMAWFDAHESLHWTHAEVAMGEDIKDWNNATKQEQDFIRNLLTFFVQADIEVEDVYLHTYLLLFGNTLPNKMCLGSAAAREGIHIRGYAHLIESLGFDESMFSEFLDVPVCKALQHALQEYSEVAQYGDALGNQTLESAYKAFCATTLFGEGVMLFGQFAMLMNFKRNNKFKGQATIVQWSVRDEDMHVQLLAKMAREHFKDVPVTTLEGWYREVYIDLMPLIIEFVDYCYAAGSPEGLERQQIVEFLAHQACRRARQAGLFKDQEVPEVSPLPWFDQMIGGTEHTNFFERRGTSYSKGNLVGKFDYTKALQLIQEV